MCDYSLHDIMSRPAKTGDQLISTHFTTTITRGFADPSEPHVAVCLLPGTELAFESEVQCDAARRFFPKWKSTWKSEHKVARFRQVNVDHPAAHHDALEFPDGRIVLVTNLIEGQRATVLQLPNTGHPASKEEAQRHSQPHPERSGV
jgi:hypothetical protein